MINQDYKLYIYHRYGTKFYEYKNKSHRLNGPAIMWPDGVQHYYVNNKLHRLDGPAVTHYDGRFDMYYVNYKKVSKEDFYQNHYKKND